MNLKRLAFRYFFSDKIFKYNLNRIKEPFGIVLMYHEVLPEDYDIPAWTVVKLSEFKWQMKYISRHLEILTLDEAIKRIYKKQVNKKPFAVVTFDDGYKGNYEYVLPEMKRLGIPFTVYIATKYIATKNFFNNIFWYDKIINYILDKEDFNKNISVGKSEINIKFTKYTPKEIKWDKIDKFLCQLKRIEKDRRDRVIRNLLIEYDDEQSKFQMINTKELKKLTNSDLVTIGSHTHGHEILDKCEYHEIYETLSKSNKIIKEISGVTPKHFAYPNGNYNKKVFSIVKNFGYKSAVTTTPDFWTKNYNLYEIPRLGIGRFDKKNCFKAILSGY